MEMWFSGDLGGAGLMVGLVLKAFFNDSMSLLYW